MYLLLLFLLLPPLPLPFFFFFWLTSRCFLLLTRNQSRNWTRKWKSNGKKNGRKKRKNVRKKKSSERKRRRTERRSERRRKSSERRTWRRRRREKGATPPSRQPLTGRARLTLTLAPLDPQILGVNTLPPPFFQLAFSSDPGCFTPPAIMRSSDFSKVYYKGYLNKKTEHLSVGKVPNRRWFTYWVVLRSHYLLFYKERKHVRAPLLFSFLFCFCFCFVFFLFLINISFCAVYE